jgi:hypothetical protein
VTIVNRRNAVVGWLVIKAGRYAAKRKAQDSVPSPKTGGIAAGTAAGLGTALLVLRRRRRGAVEG